MESASEKDESSNKMPNFVYISREKKTIAHNYKAGVLNVLVIMFIIVVDISYTYIGKQKVVDQFTRHQTLMLSR